MAILLIYCPLPKYNYTATIVEKRNASEFLKTSSSFHGRFSTEVLRRLKRETRKPSLFFVRFLTRKVSLQSIMRWMKVRVLRQEELLKFVQKQIGQYDPISVQ